MLTPGHSRENEDAPTTSLTLILSEMREILQEQRDSIQVQLEAWSAKQETLLQGWFQRTSGAGGGLIDHDSGRRMTSVVTGSNMLRQSHNLAETGSNTLGKSPQISRTQQLRKSAVERSAWRGSKSLQCVRQSLEETHVGSEDGPEQNYLSTRRSRSQGPLFDPDRIVQQMCVDRVCEPELTQGVASRASVCSSTSLHLKYCGLLLSKLRNLIKSRPFDLVCGVLIIGNIALLGVEVNFLASTGSVPGFATLCQTVLNLWYFAELWLRYWASPHRFCAPEEWRWNAVDVFTTIPSILDLAAEALSLTDPTLLRTFRTLRMLRIARLLRIAKQLTYVREFRKMAFSLLSSIQTLLWSTLLIFFIIYSFALWFTQSAASIRSSSAQVDEQVLQDLEKYFGSLGHSIGTLFMSITNGMDWGNGLEVLLGANDVLSSSVFCAYVALCCFGLLNIVTSVFVDCALQSTQYYKDLLVEEKTSEANAITDHMKRIFSELAGDLSGTISFLQMEGFLDNPDTHLHAYFEALGLEVDDARAFFRLLDVDGSGHVDIDEFCHGCKKLKGDAKSIDLNCMIYEGRAMVRTWSEFMYFVEQEFKSLKTDWRSIAWTTNVLLQRLDSYYPPNISSLSLSSCENIAPVLLDL